MLRYFGEDLKTARKKYREFVSEGISKGRREELRGGGLIRSAGGSIFGVHNEDRELSDDRILGSGDFVAEALRVANNSFEETSGLKRMPLSELSRKV